MYIFCKNSIPIQSHLSLVAKFCLIVTILPFTTKLNAQLNNWQVNSTIHIGKIVPHRSYFTPQITEPTFQYEISWSKQTTGKALWSRAYKKPEYGVGLVLADFGDKNIFGRGIGILPFLNFKRQYKPFNFNMKVGVGLAYITKTYHPINNPTNNGIGGHFNNLTRFELGFQRQIIKQLSASANLSVTHYSNGNTEQPNLGINILGASIGLTYLFNPSNTQYPDTLPQHNKRFKISLHTGFGVGSLIINGGPNYPVYVTGIYLNRNVSIKGRIMLGLNYEYHYSTRRFIELMGSFNESKNLKSSQIMVMGGYELLLNHFSIPVQIGTYIYNPFLKKGNLVVKLGAKYHFKDTYQPNRFNPYFGIFLKAHGASADFTELAVGIEF